MYEDMVSLNSLAFSKINVTLTLLLMLAGGHAAAATMEIKNNDQNNELVLTDANEFGCIYYLDQLRHKVYTIPAGGMIKFEATRHAGGDCSGQPGQFSFWKGDERVSFQLHGIDGFHYVPSTSSNLGTVIRNPRTGVSRFETHLVPKTFSVGKFKGSWHWVCTVPFCNESYETATVVGRATKMGLEDQVSKQISSSISAGISYGAVSVDASYGSSTTNTTTQSLEREFSSSSSSKVTITIPNDMLNTAGVGKVWRWQMTAVDSSGSPVTVFTKQRACTKKGVASAPTVMPGSSAAELSCQ
jgi:hypothetical protein